jgi:uncharacterized RDD family membrane protein YckC
MTNQATASALAPAEMRARLIAYIIDAAILAVAYLVVITTIVIAAFVQGDTSIIAIASRSVLFALASLLYFGYTWTTMRASPGQRAMGIQTVNAADGATLTGTQAILRWAYLFGPSALASLFTNAQQVGLLSFVVNVAVIAYYIYLYRTAANDPKRQGFHDRQTGTIVVKAAA